MRNLFLISLCFFLSTGCFLTKKKAAPVEEPAAPATPTVTAPAISVTTPTNDTTPTWSWVSADGTNGSGTFRYKLDSSDLSTGATETTSLNYTPDSALGEGTHTLYVQERHTNGTNWGSLGTSVAVIDITAPQISSSSNSYSGITIIFNESMNTDDANISYTFNGESNLIASDTTKTWSSNNGIANSKLVIAPDTGHLFATASGKVTITVKDLALNTLSNVDVDISRNNNNIPIWAKGGGASNSAIQSTFTSVAATADGGFVAAGHFFGGAGSLDLGNSVSVTQTTARSYILVVKYNSHGVAQWAKTLVSGAGNSYINSVTTDSSSNVIVAGSVVGTGAFDFGNGVSLTGSAASYSGFVAKYSAAGNALWAKNGADLGYSQKCYSQFLSVATDNVGNAIAVGILGPTSWSTQAGCNFGGTTLVSVLTTPGNYGPTAMFVKFDADDGSIVWANASTGGYDSYLYGVAVNQTTNDIYAVGKLLYTNVGKTYAFNGANISAGSFTSNFAPVIVKINSAGAGQWAKSTYRTGSSGYGTNNTAFKSVVLDNSGNAYVAGTLSYGTYDFGTVGSPLTVNAHASIDKHALLVKYNSAGAAQWVRSVYSPSDISEFVSVAISPSTAHNPYQMLYAVGYMKGANTLQFNDVTITGTSTGNNPFLLMIDTNKSDFIGKISSTASATAVFNGVAAAVHDLAEPTFDDVYVAGQIGTAEHNFGNGVTFTSPLENTTSNMLLLKY